MMTTRRLGLLLLALVLPVGPHSAPAQETKPLQILFVGNSYTYVNDLPKMLTELAKAGGQQPILAQKETPGGWSFKKHWEGGKTLPKIESRKWDYVVLQDQSLGALQAKNDMLAFGKKLDEAVKKQGARTILYMTWARQNKPETQDQITQAYQQLAKEIKADVAPVGLAWQAALKADSKPTLHSKDMSHPSTAGTYLAACVFYATIYGKSPEGLPGKIGGVTVAQALELQKTAWKVVNQK
jgi:hypothetical protein